MNKKFYILLLACLLIPGFLQAATERLEMNLKNCSKIKGLSQEAVEYLASRYKVSISSFRFMRAEPQTDAWCNVVVDTPQGPNTFLVLSILTNNKGKSAFAGSIY